MLEKISSLEVRTPVQLQCCINITNLHASAQAEHSFRWFPKLCQFGLLLFPIILVFLLFLTLIILSNPIAGIINIYALLFHVAAEGATAAQLSQPHMKEKEANYELGE